MKVMGFLLLLAGWAIGLAAIVLLGSASRQTGFVLAGIGVEGLGLGLIARAHLVLPEDEG
jgi:hypothetical protein